MPIDLFTERLLCNRELGIRKLVRMINETGSVIPVGLDADVKHSIHHRLRGCGFCIHVARGNSRSSLHISKLGLHSGHLLRHVVDGNRKVVFHRIEELRLLASKLFRLCGSLGNTVQNHALRGIRNVVIGLGGSLCTRHLAVQGIDVSCRCLSHLNETSCLAMKGLLSRLSLLKHIFGLISLGFGNDFVFFSFLSLLLSLF
mmetsp:Transcript_5389/g.16326  ORF Transcript_5389/g.16326 Transcript_5389/m.16326 type:complete len:201 (-) Transcript_5389:1395-1997(-)